jgi:transposase
VETREQRGVVIAATKRIKQQNGKWLVPSQQNISRKYTVCADGDKCSCTCPDFEERGQPCKHVFAVRIVIQRELFDDGTEVETRQVTITEQRRTYPQIWPAYNRAQTSEKSTLQSLLYDLCQSIPESTETRMGRPRLSARDGVFCAAMKVYSMLSSRRFHSDMCEAQERGYIAHVPHFNSMQRFFDSPETESVLKSLVSQSAAPLAAIETNFAVDSTGFSGCRYERWDNVKWHNAVPRIALTWVKAHAMVGVNTNVVTAVEVLDSYSGDHDNLVPLMHRTAEQFQIGEVSADKAYLSEVNLHAITAIGGKAFIPFKSNSKPRHPGVWNSAYHFFNLHRQTFLEHYHQRSNVESAFSAIKRKFGDSVKAKNVQSMKCEVLAKFLCHNLSCLIHAMEELGTDLDFGCTKSQPLAPNVIRA